MLSLKKVLGLDLCRACGGNSYRRVALYGHAASSLTQIRGVVVEQIVKSPAESGRLLLCTCHAASLNSRRELFCDLKVFLRSLGALVVVVGRLAEAGCLGELDVTRDLGFEDLVAVVLIKLGDNLHREQ